MRSKALPVERPARTVGAAMIRLLVTSVALTFALAEPVPAQQLAHGKLVVTRAGKGRIDLASGQAAFWFQGWELLPGADSNGIDPAAEPFAIGIAEEKFIIPAGQLKASRSGKHFRYTAHTDRGVERVSLARTPTGSFKVSLRIAGVDLSTLVVSDPPLCLSFAVIVGDDDGFSGVTFDRPKPFPSKLLTLPGFCTSNPDWPWA